MAPELIHSKNFVSDAVTMIHHEAESAILKRGEFRLALSGGNTPKPVYQALAKEKLEWDKFIITFGDERCVPPENSQSNYLMAKTHLFDLAPIPTQNILRMRGEIPPAEAACAYERELDQRARSGIYRHDLILLGMGDDGHTASLFPGTPALAVINRRIIENFVPKLDMWRLTFTYPLINAARHVCFLVNSSGKEAVLEQVFSGHSNFPCAAVKPTEGKVTWLLGGG